MHVKVLAWALDVTAIVSKRSICRRHRTYIYVSVFMVYSAMDDYIKKILYKY